MKDPKYVAMKARLVGVLDDIAIAADALEDDGQRVAAGTLRHKGVLIKQAAAAPVGRWETLFAYR